MFVPLTHSASEAQVDFGEAVVVLAGVEWKTHYLVMGLPHSDDCFVVAFSAETTEVFLKGHVRAFAYFGGVPTRILDDNTKIALAKNLGRQRTRAFSELQSHYLFADKFGRHAKSVKSSKLNISKNKSVLTEVSTEEHSFARLMFGFLRSSIRPAKCQTTIGMQRSSRRPHVTLSFLKT